MTRRAATSPRLMSCAPSIRKNTGVASTATYPYTATISPTVISPAAVIRAASQVTAARNRLGRPTATPSIQLATAPTR